MGETEPIFDPNIKDLPPEEEAKNAAAYDERRKKDLGYKLEDAADKVKLDRKKEDLRQTLAASVRRHKEETKLTDPKEREWAEELEAGSLGIPKNQPPTKDEAVRDLLIYVRRIRGPGTRTLN